MHLQIQIIEHRHINEDAYTCIHEELTIRKYLHLHYVYC